MAAIFYEKVEQLRGPLPPAQDPSIFPTEFLGDLYTARREDGSYTRVLCDWVRLLMMVVGVTATVKVDNITVKAQGTFAAEIKRLFNLVSTQAQSKILADETKMEEVKAAEVLQWREMQGDHDWGSDYLNDHSIPGEDDSILQRLNAGRVAHLDDRWVDRLGAHVMGLTFFKADGQYYLIRSNKGAGAIDEIPGISIYRVDNVAGIATKKDVEHFLKNCTVTEFSENMDPTKQGGVAHYLGLHKIAEFTKTHQKTGNCGTANLINYMLAFLMAKYTQSQFGIERAADAAGTLVSAGAGQETAVSASSLISAIPDGFFDHCYTLIRDTQFKSLRAMVREIGIESLVEMGMEHTHPVVMEKTEHIAMMQQVMRYIHTKYREPKPGEAWSGDVVITHAENKSVWFKAVTRLADDVDKSPYSADDFEQVMSVMASKGK